MKTKQSLIGIAVVCMSFAIFFACKKQEIPSQPVTNNEQAIKTAFQQFRETFLKSASAADQKNFNALLPQFNYASSAMITVGDDETLFLVTVTQAAKTGSSKFFAVRQKQKDFAFDGVYEAKSVDAIRSVFTAKTLPKGDSVFVRGLNGYPAKEWLAAADGSLEYREARGSKINDIEKLKSALKSGPGATKYKLAVVDEGEGCTYWYWWIYMPGYGWVPVIFLYSTGCENEEIGNSGSPVEPDINDCSKMTEDQAMAELSAIEWSDNELPIATVTVTGDVEVNATTGKIRRPILINQKVIRCSFHLVPNVIWYSMFYTGVGYKDNGNDQVWKFESCEYSSGGQSEGQVPPCYEIQTQFISTPVVIADDKTHADAYYYASAIYKLSCSKGFQENTKYASNSIRLLPDYQ